MLRLDGPTSPHLCQAVHRRDFLHAGSLAFLGLTLPGFMELRAAGRTTPDKDVNCILLFLEGGAPQMDTWDPKPDAPAEIRGPYKPIATNVAGIRITELFPRMARHADKFALIRSCYHTNPAHPQAKTWMQTGLPPLPGIQYPHPGCVVDKLKGARGDLPAHILLPYRPDKGQGPGFLGKTHEPFVIDSDPSDPSFRVRDLRPPDYVSAVRARRRISFRRLIDRSFLEFEENCAESRLLDANFSQAYRIVSSRQARQSFDLTGEPDPLRQSYGMNRFGQSCLLARRLVERGVRFVTVNMFDDLAGSWDIHGQAPFTSLSALDTLGPMFDQAFSSLLEDLQQRGMLEQTLVVAMGEFGRSPKINPAGGRDHWPACGTLILAGGGVVGGQVIGSSDRTASEPRDRPVEPMEILASLYHALGISIHTELDGPGSRPVPVVEIGVEPIRELFGAT